MQKKILGQLLLVLIGVLIGSTVLPALCQQLGQKMFVGTKSQKEFESFTLEKKLATLNLKLDYLIQKGLPAGRYIDGEGVVQNSIRTRSTGSGGAVSGGGTFRLDEKLRE